MLTFYGQKDMLLRERDQVLALLTSSHLNPTTLFGYKLKPGGSLILTVPGENGSVRIYHLTTLPDSLSGQGRTDAGMKSTATAKQGNEHEKA